MFISLWTYEFIFNNFCQLNFIFHRVYDNVQQFKLLFYVYYVYCILNLFYISYHSILHFKDRNNF